MLPKARTIVITMFFIYFPLKKSRLIITSARDQQYSSQRGENGCGAQWSTAPPDRFIAREINCGPASRWVQHCGPNLAGVHQLGRKPNGLRCKQDPIRALFLLAVVFVSPAFASVIDAGAHAVRGSNLQVETGAAGVAGQQFL